MLKGRAAAKSQTRTDLRREEYGKAVNCLWPNSTSVRVIFAQIERTNDKRRTNWLGAMGAVAKEDERGEKRLLSLPARLIAPLIFHGMTSDELRSVGPASHLVDSPSSWLPS